MNIPRSTLLYTNSWSIGDDHVSESCALYIHKYSHFSALIQSSIIRVKDGTFRQLVSVYLMMAWWCIRPKQWVRLCVVDRFYWHGHISKTMNFYLPSTCLTSIEHFLYDLWKFRCRITMFFDNNLRKQCYWHCITKLIFKFNISANKAIYQYLKYKLWMSYLISGRGMSRVTWWALLWGCEVLVTDVILVIKY